MYRCFKLLMSKGDFFEQSPEAIRKWKTAGQRIKEKLEGEMDDILSKVTNPDDIMDGEKLSDIWFPITDRDIFISYSHNDEELALMIAGILEDFFGLSVFMDSLVWGRADSLLRIIDNEYCLQDNGNYNYEKRNFSTSHVHALLTTSIMRAMDRSEVVLFLNTSNSVYKLKDGFAGEYTLSPWIYEEMVCSRLLRIREWDEHRTTSLNEGHYFAKSLNVAYPSCLEELKEISFVTLCEWVKEWDKRKVNDSGKYGSLLLKPHERIKHPLNVLYEIVLGIKLE